MEGDASRGRLATPPWLGVTDERNPSVPVFSAIAASFLAVALMNIPTLSSGGTRDISPADDGEG
jgi:hypothetical protein